MSSLLPFVPAPPLFGFLLLALLPCALPRALVQAIGVGCCVVSGLLLALAATAGLVAVGVIVPIVGFDLGDVAVQVAVELSPVGVLTGATVIAVGALVLLYAAGSMHEERTRDLRRFFALMNLFLSGMLCVVLAADVVLLFLGWEVIGLCSFFLIAFFTQRRQAVAAGRKALVMTRIADAMLLAGFILWILASGSTRFDAMLAAVPGMAPGPLTVIATLVAAGALGKSAQLPLQTWLPSAMTGPTPVSALLHSATMVAAGVILLARLAPLYAATPSVAAVVAFVGVTTAAFAALAAVVQTDVKKLLAYSTISQMGFMVLVLGVGAPAIALAHFAIHAAFKSLLFLSAGTMSHAVGGSTAIEDLRGSRRRQPLGYYAFAAGATSLAGLPLVTAGWFSKEAVLGAVFASGPTGSLLWLLATVAAVLTGTYVFRVLFVAAQPGGGEAAHPETVAATIPLVALGAIALGGGMAVESLIDFAGGSEPAIPYLLAVVGGAAPLLGILLASRLTRRPHEFERLRVALRPIKAFDHLYGRVVVRSYRRLSQWLAGPDTGAPRPAGDLVGRAGIAAAVVAMTSLVRLCDRDRIDSAWAGSARAVGAAATRARRLQTGRLRDYALAVGLGLAGLLLLAGWTAWH